MHEVEPRGLFTFCVCVSGHQAKTHPTFCGKFFTDTACNLSTSETGCSAFYNAKHNSFFRCIRMSPSTIKRPHNFTGSQRPFSFSVSWSCASSSRPWCTHELHFRHRPSLLSFPPAVTCFARNNLPHAHLNHARVFLGVSHMIVNIATCSASSRHPTPPPRQI